MKPSHPIKILKKISNTLFSTSAAGLYIVLFALAISIATFVENDFGTSSAQKVIFKSWWFELLLVLFGVSLVVNIFRFRMVQQKKWAILVFHAAFIVVLVGAGVTRYFGSEGIMHIREGSASSTFHSTENYLQFETLFEGRKYVFEEPVLFATLGDNHLKRSYLIGNNKVDVEVLDFMPNPKEEMVQDENGVAILKVVLGGSNGREEYHVKYKDRVNIRGTIFNFGNPEEPDAFNIKYEGNNLMFRSNATYTQMQMATQTRDTLVAGTYHRLMIRSLYSKSALRLHFGGFAAFCKMKVQKNAPTCNTFFI